MATESRSRDSSYVSFAHLPEDVGLDSELLPTTSAFQGRLPDQPSLRIPRPMVVGSVSQLGPYRLLRELGAGGMGIVYEAEDIHLNRRVALKVLRPNLPSEQAGRERFLREARAMAALTHDNITPIYQVGEEAGLPYMAMQLLQGETLEARLTKPPRLPLTEVVRIGAEVASGLAAAHARGLIHRDIKPANIFLELPNSRVKLLDFGLARVNEPGASLTQSDFVIGTPAYMSPEQARGEPLDARSDLFSLGVVLYEMTTGDRPFDGPTAVAVMRNLELHAPPRVNVSRPDVPALLSNLIMELLAKVPRDRPASALEVADRLRKINVVRSSRIPVAPFRPASASVDTPRPVATTAVPPLVAPPRPATPAPVHGSATARMAPPAPLAGETSGRMMRPTLPTPTAPTPGEISGRMERPEPGAKSGSIAFLPPSSPVPVAPPNHGLLPSELSGAIDFNLPQLPLPVPAPQPGTAAPPTGNDWYQPSGRFGLPARNKPKTEPTPSTHDYYPNASVSGQISRARVQDAMPANPTPDRPTVPTMEPHPSAPTPYANETVGGYATPPAPPPGEHIPAWKYFAIILMLALGLASGYYLLTDRGEVLLTTDDPTAEVEVARGGDIVHVLKLGEARRTSLRVGEYELRLRTPRPGQRLEPVMASVKRGQVFSVKLVTDPDRR